MALRARVAAGFAIGLQLAVLYAPLTPQVDGGGLPLDKLVHVVVFGLPTAALVLAGVARSWAVGLMAAQAVLSEVVQHQFLASRSGDPMDVLADLIGVGIGALLVGGRRAGGRQAGTGQAGGRQAGTGQAGGRQAGTGQAGGRQAGTGQAGTGQTASGIG